MMLSLKKKITSPCAWRVLFCWPLTPLSELFPPCLANRNTCHISRVAFIGACDARACACSLCVTLCCFSIVCQCLLVRHVHVSTILWTKYVLSRVMVRTNTCTRYGSKAHLGLGDDAGLEHFCFRHCFVGITHIVPRQCSPYETEWGRLSTRDMKRGSEGTREQGHRREKMYAFWYRDKRHMMRKDARECVPTVTVAVIARVSPWKYVRGEFT